MKLYKLTDEHGQTHSKTQWGENVTNTANGEGDLCGPGWIHAYTDPLLAVFLNPVHADFKSPQLWEAEGEVGKEDCGLKVGCTSLTTIRRMNVPAVTTEHCVRFAVLCVRQVYSEPAFLAWSEKWLSGEDRSGTAAWAAAEAAKAAAWAAAKAAKAAKAAWAAWAAEAAKAAAKAAAWAAEVAAEVAKASPLDLIHIAQESASASKGETT